MSRDPQEMLVEFHHALGDPVPDAPAAVLGGMVTDPELRLARDELDELAEAVAAGDVAGAAHEMADVIYAVYGYAARNGIDLTAVLAEVHRANMSKLDGGPVIRPDGKVIKGPNYRAPDVAAVLARQGNEPAVGAPKGWPLGYLACGCRDNGAGGHVR